MTKYNHPNDVADTTYEAQHPGDEGWPVPEGVPGETAGLTVQIAPGEVDAGTLFAVAHHWTIHSPQHTTYVRKADGTRYKVLAKGDAGYDLASRYRLVVLDDD
jgi:hypothetical protein